MPSTRDELERLGFTGYVRFAELPTQDVPTAAGVYAVVRVATAPPEFLPVSPGGRFKSKDPTVPIERLRTSWVEGVHTVYVGQTSRGRDGLRRRLDAYRRFGAGEPVGHWGGRFIWQLADSDRLTVAWLATPDRDAADVETELLIRFVERTGVLPFANLRHGRRFVPPRTDG